MQFLSLRQMFDNSKAVVRRFPFSFAMMVVMSVAGICLVYGSAFEKNLFVATLFAGMTGYVGFLALEQFLERKKFGNKKVNLFKMGLLAVIIGLGVYYHYLFDVMLELWSYNREGIVFLRIFTFGVLAFVAYLLSPLAAVKKEDKEEVFWRHGMFFLMRALQAFALFALAYFGLMLFLVAGEELLDFDYSLMENLMLVMLVLFSCFFGQLFFLSGVPKDLAKIKDEDFHAKQLKVLTNYVLWPMTIAYMALMLILTLKSVFVWEMPSNVDMGWFVFFGLVGVLAHFVVYKAETARYLKFWKKYFYFIFTPVMLFFVVVMWNKWLNGGRWDDIWVSDYVGVMFGLWLFVSGALMLIPKIRSVRNILYVGLVVLLLLNVGPWSLSQAIDREEGSREHCEGHGCYYI